MYRNIKLYTKVVDIMFHVKHYINKIKKESNIYYLSISILKLRNKTIVNNKLK